MASSRHNRTRRFRLVRAEAPDQVAPRRQRFRDDASSPINTRRAVGMLLPQRATGLGGDRDDEPHSIRAA
jgi:hypothetical protein